MAYRNLLCPVDFSHSSELALRNAAALAKSMGASLVVLHVYELPSHLLPPYGFAIAPELLESARAQAREALERNREQAERLVGAPVAAVLVDDTPWHGVVEYARAHGTDLVVVGTHGRTGVRHALLGSVAERVVRHAPCAVLVVRDEPK